MLWILIVISTIFIISSVSASDLNESDSSAEINEVISIEENHDLQAEDDDILSDTHYPNDFENLKSIISNAKDNDTIVLNGTYLFQQTVSIDKSLTFVGVNNAIVDGLSKVRLFVSNDGVIIFKNITFKNGRSSTNGGAISGKGYVKDCIFVNCSATAYGGALSGVDAENCIFINNSVTSDYSYGGGAMYHGVAINCTFKYNFAYAGGAIFETNVFNSTFIGNKGLYKYGYTYGYKDYSKLYSGGAICGGNVHNCTFINNSAEYGGAIFINSENSIISNCSFRNNNATNGGAVYYTFPVIAIKNLIFDNNSATNRGNEIFINSSNAYGTSDWLLSLVNCSFINSVSSNNAWFIEFTNRKNNKNNYLSISKSNFINCSSKGNGGAIVLVNVISCSIDDCYFEGNSAVNGGAIYYDGHISSLNNCHFKNNHAQYGGAIFYQNYNEIINCSFERNIASNNGNDIFFNESTEINIVKCNFTNYNSKNQWFIGFNKVENLSISNCNFINCSSNSNGGAIHLKNICSCNITNCYFEGNSVHNEGELLFEDDVVKGGAIFLENIHSINVSYCTFINNKAGKGGAISVSCSTYCLLDNNTFKDNTVSYAMSFGGHYHVNGVGGAIFTEDNNVIVNNSYFNNNRISISGSGGAILGNVSVFNSIFIGNYGGATGGAIQGGCVENSTFINNHVNYAGGGAIAKTNAINCRFIDNGAASGGAIIEGNAIGCYFEGNSARNYGGSICDGNATNCCFINNTAYKGGAFYNSGTSEMYLNNCSFMNNSANNGGAIYSDNLTVKNCEFINCSSSNEGGAIYCQSGSSLNIYKCSFINCSSGDGNSYLCYDKDTSKCNISDCEFDIVPEGIEYKYNPILKVNDLNIVKGENSVLIVNLSDITGQLYNKTIKFKIDGNTVYYNTTDVNGILIFKVDEYITEEGYYNITVSFDGDDHVNSISTYSNVYIYSYKGFLTLTQIGKYYDDVVLSLKLINSKTNEDINNATIKVEFSNGKIVYLKTDDQGTAIYNVPFAPGTYNVTAYVNNSNVDVNNASIFNFVINNIEGIMRVSQVENNILNVRLFNQKSGDSFKNINVTLKFNNLNPFYIVTNEQGIATYNMQFEPGTYSVLATVASQYCEFDAVALDNIEITNGSSESGSGQGNIKTDSRISFSPVSITFYYGQSGSTIATVFGGSVSKDNIKVDNHPEAKIDLVGNRIIISGLNPGSYTLRVPTTPDENYYSVVSTVAVTVNNIPVNIKVSSLSTYSKSGDVWKFRLTDSSNGRPLANMQVNLKVFTGSSYQIIPVTTNSNGEGSVAASKWSVGTHKVILTFSKRGYASSSVSSSVKVLKTTKLSFKVKSKADKTGSTLSVWVKSGKKYLNGVKLKIYVYNGKKVVKTITVVTGKYKDAKKKINKGFIAYGTNALKAGKHKIVIKPVSKKYTGSKTTKLSIKKTAKKYKKTSVVVTKGKRHVID